MPSTEMQDVHLCILAGGSGTRLWPRSRESRPKQLQSLVGTRSMLRQTIDRTALLIPLERTYILAGPEHARLIADHLPELPRENLFIEPAPRGTAPALGMAAMRLRQTLPPESIMVSLHADHAMRREEEFREALRVAIATAREGHLVTIGIVPTHPETGFGYIERGEALADAWARPVFRVARFVEKPPLEQARMFVQSDRYYWNTGYFSWRLDRILDAFERYLPRMYTQLAEIAAMGPIAYTDQQLLGVWEEIERVTIDVGIMERATNVAIIPCDLGWNDVGSWASLLDILPHDADDNVVLGGGTHVGLGTTNSLIHTGERLVATIGLEDMVVVDTGDVVLVLPRSRAQEVSALVKELRARGLDAYL